MELSEPFKQLGQYFLIFTIGSKPATPAAEGGADDKPASPTEDKPATPAAGEGEDKPSTPEGEEAKKE